MCSDNIIIILLICSSVSIWSEPHLECHHSAVDVETPGSSGSRPACGKTGVFFFPPKAFARFTRRLTAPGRRTCARYPSTLGHMLRYLPTRNFETFQKAQTEASHFPCWLIQIFLLSAAAVI